MECKPTTTMTPLSHLHSLYLDYNRKAYPNMPAVCIPKPDYKVNTTNGMTKAIVDFIRFSGGHAERVHTMGRQIKAKSGKQIWIQTTATKGSSDIHAIWHGRTLAIEVKNAATRDRISAKQQEYGRLITMAGGVYYVATTFESFYYWFQTLPQGPQPP